MYKYENVLGIIYRQEVHMGEIIKLEFDFLK